jgi:hypothetical protein
VPQHSEAVLKATIARAIVAASLMLAAAACGYDASATFNPDGSVVVGLKFLFPKSLMNGSNGTSVSGLSPSDLRSANAQLQKKYPGGKVTAVTDGDETGAMVTVPFKTEKDAFAFLTQPSTLSPSGATSGSSLGLNLSNTGGMFKSARHTTSGSNDTYTFTTAPATQPTPSSGSQQVLTDDEVQSIFTITFAVTLPHVITSAPGALFTIDRKTATWKLHWTRSETLIATTGPDTALAGSVAPLQDARPLVAVGFIALSVGFLLGMLGTSRGLLTRRHPAPVAVAVAPPAQAPGEIPGPPPGAAPPAG